MNDTNHNTGWAHGLIDSAKTFAIVVAIMLVPRTVLCQPFTIPSASMEPTLLVGDYILVSKFPYGISRHSAPFSPPLGKGRLFGHEPARGDVVVFKKPGGKAVAQRPVATRVEDSAYGYPIVVDEVAETLPNGRRYLTHVRGPDTAAANTGVYTVPAGCFFVMGDNRDNSVDSRFDPGQAPANGAACAWNAELDRYLPPETGMGFIPFDNLVGRAERILFSWDGHKGLRLDRTMRSLSAPKI
jgi:signal peptidase I